MAMDGFIFIVTPCDEMRSRCFKIGTRIATTEGLFEEEASFFPPYLDHSFILNCGPNVSRIYDDVMAELKSEGRLVHHDNGIFEGDYHVAIEVIMRSNKIHAR